MDIRSNRFLRVGSSPGTEGFFIFLAPPRNRGGVIFSLQFVSVSVCPALPVNKIPAERMKRFGRGFR